MATLVLRGTDGYVRTPKPLTLQILEPALDSSPTTLEITITGATPEATVTFAIEQDDLSTDVYSDTVDTFGDLYLASIPVPETQAGVYQLTATTSTGQSGAATFTLAYDPETVDPALPAEAPPPTDTTPGRWTFVDPAPDGALPRWEMIYNPSVDDGPLIEKALDPRRTTYTAGKHRIAGGASRPAVRRTLRGFMDTQAEYERAVAYLQLNRRIWLIDHRRRAFKVGMISGDFTPRLRTAGRDGSFNDWAQDYEITIDVLHETWEQL